MLYLVRLFWDIVLSVCLSVLLYVVCTAYDAVCTVLYCTDAVRSYWIVLCKHTKQTHDVDWNSARGAAAWTKSCDGLDFYQGRDFCVRYDAGVGPSILAMTHFSTNSYLHALRSALRHVTHQLRGSTAQSESFEFVCVWRNRRER